MCTHAHEGVCPCLYVCVCAWSCVYMEQGLKLCSWWQSQDHLHPVQEGDLAVPYLPPFPSRAPDGPFRMRHRTSGFLSEGPWGSG